MPLIEREHLIESVAPLLQDELLIPAVLLRRFHRPFFAI